MVLLAAAGTTAFPILEMTPSGKAAGMGEAWAAISGGPQWVFLNPAGTGHPVKPSASFALSPSAIYTLAAFSAVIPFVEESFLSFGISGYAFSEEGWDENNKSLGTIYYGEYVAAVSIKRTFWEAFDIGLSLKYAYRGIYDYQERAVLIDFGTLTQITGMKVGLSLKNAGFSNASGIPLGLRIGFASQLFNFKGGFLKLTLTGDLYATQNIGFEWSAGVEGSYRDMFFLRIGYNSKFSKNYSAFSGATIGLGVLYRSFDISYSVKFHEMFGLMHTVEVSYSP